ncbi:hypothetical protein DTO013E5_3537 [Penicillium roqueforti]|uniref:uncharacterized protein n=1 Tax=Penicillium roqueforti TaxID=5082 RepID=UPI001909BD15|nr:uncharacterized protein LCP9604111_6785 [Penicillium roqueforti]KAF9245467.1 hypothetical protein LCP9604111_6785 [Penicillium roqueforti]KAI1832869.1 hypothetical protein CBS147337_6280 [Penicillium roqueforti]KAI2675919.1 hypothetical protein CBS147355_6100 [Penicillium roqueforti]KAI2707593.1 hypothetical protein CBS147332_6651 [Penicillium roqueforti]KAI2723992.1 hypothetical protein CBS147318_923 [Penicillium roqueforti]
MYQEAIARLRNYIPPPTTYYSVPVSRRAAVLLLLFADAKGDLRVVVTIRAKTLSSYAGDAALPGGRAENTESAFQTARREACEEIGLPDIQEREKLPPPFSVEHLCEFPANLARTEVVVRPCVALLHSYDAGLGLNSNPEVSLIPILDTREVEVVFTAPFQDFLRGHGENGEDWYRGSWGMWHNSQWRMHQFFVPRADQVYRIFGMTARIIVDAARVAYAQEPEFEHNSHFGDEAMIADLRQLGRLGEKAKV